MPKNAQQRLSKRRAPTQKETYRHSQGLEVVARPTDYQGEVDYPSSNLNTLVKALESGQGFMSSYAQYKKQKNIADKEAGYWEGKAGKEKPEDASSAKVRGWLMAQGEADAFELEKQVTEYVQTSFDQDPESFQQGLNELMSSYMDGKSESYLKGFVPQAEKVEQKTYRSYMETNHERTLSKGLDNVSKGFRHQLENMEEMSPEKIRSLVSESQKKGRSFGLTRDVVTSRLLTLVGRQAELEGDPSLLDFTEVPDSEGIRLSSTKHADDVRMWKERAKDAQVRQENAEEAKLATYRKRAKAQAERTIGVQMAEVDPTDTQQILRIKQSLISTWSNPQNNKYGIALDGNDLNKYITQLNDYMDLEGFSDNTDEMVHGHFTRNIQKARTEHELTGIRDSLYIMRDQFTPSDFRSMLGRITNEMNQIENQDYNEGKNRTSSYISKTNDVVKINPDPLAMYDNPEQRRIDARRVSLYEELMFDAVEEYKTDHDGKFPPTEWKEARSKTIAQTVKDRYPNPGVFFPGAGGGTNTGTSGNQDKTNNEDNQGNTDPILEGLDSLAP